MKTTYKQAIDYITRNPGIVLAMLRVLCLKSGSTILWKNAPKEIREAIFDTIDTQEQNARALYLEKEQSN